jgi:hypothetical protein
VRIHRLDDANELGRFFQLLDPTAHISRHLGVLAPSESQS